MSNPNFEKARDEQDYSKRLRIANSHYVTPEQIPWLKRKADLRQQHDILLERRRILQAELKDLEDQIGVLGIQHPPLKNRQGIECEDAFFAAYQLNFPNMAEACRQTNVARETVNNYRKRYPTFAAKFEAIREEETDKVERALFDAALDTKSHPLNRAMVLNNNRPERYGDKRQLTVNGNVAHIHGSIGSWEDLVMAKRREIEGQNVVEGQFREEPAPRQIQSGADDD